MNRIETFDQNVRQLESTMHTCGDEGNTAVKGFADQLSSLLAAAELHEYFGFVDDDPSGEGSDDPQSNEPAGEK
jgi:hypothetical protein